LFGIDGVCHWATKVVKGLILELDAQFLEQSILDVVGIVYPQY
jgi:hypothetical protein